MGSLVSLLSFIEKLMGNSASQMWYPSMKTWILKIDCSCEKCQKNVMKVLLDIDAVHAVSIEPGGQKATVIGTLASADVLLKTLQKKCGNAGNDGGGNANHNAAVAQGKMQNKTLKTQKEQNSGRHEDNGQVEEDLVSTGRQKVFKMEALEVATDNFDKDNKVGEGGFGAVYKGTTHDGKQIAVKKMSLTSNERRKEFMNEKLLAEVQHRNLVNLLGSCEQESQGFLVYEYMPNKSLDKFLFDPENRKRLDWHKRYNIIQGIARGLQYLHEDSRVRIVHRDVKPSNILLDEKLNPKIADFGTANLFPEDRTHVTATSPVGTFGYMPPEYVMTGRLSERTDVYSFGIVLLELLTGEKISSDALNLLGWVWRSYKRKEVVPTIDPTIIETWDKEKGTALRCIQVALLCTQEDLSLRPTMSRVTTMLSTSESLPVPKKPPFQPPTRRSWF